MNEALVEGEVLNKQRGSDWIQCSGSSSAMAIPLGRAHGRSVASETIHGNYKYWLGSGTCVN